jgi:hypothetical protein
MYRSIETDTWSDPWFSELGAPAKLIFLYLVTNGHVDAAGCCEVTLRIMAFETGLEQEQLTKIIPKLAPQVVWWPEHSIFWVRNFLRRQAANTNAANFRKSASRALRTRPDEIQTVVLAQYPELIMDEDASMDTTKGNHASPMHADASPMHAETVSVSVSEQKQEKEKPSVSLRSTSPRGSRIPAFWPTAADLDEMNAYGESLGINAGDVASHVSEFHDYWSQATKNATSLDWVKRWRSRFGQDVRDGKVGGRASSNGRAAPTNGNGTSRATAIYRPEKTTITGHLAMSDEEMNRRHAEAERRAAERMAANG